MPHKPARACADSSGAGQGSAVKPPPAAADDAPAPTPTTQPTLEPSGATAIDRTAPLRTWRLTLAYDGTQYAGWQTQANAKTLQATLEAALLRITGETISVAASGRTDAGVHALAQVVSFQSATHLPAPALLRALNANLPEDMAVQEVALAAARFHARRDALRKRYRYVLEDGPVRDVFRRRYVWQMREPLDAEAMHRAARALVGTHDFRSFESHWPNRETSVRTVYELSVRRQAPAAPHCVQVEIEADGFLYNMVRAIVGTLVEVGRGAQDEDWPAWVLAAQDRSVAGMTAPAQGLFLVRVEYPPPDGAS